MRRNQTLSQRAQMSVTQPRSRVSEGSSQRAASGWRFGSNTSHANSAAAQIAARLQTKMPTAGPRAAGAAAPPGACVPVSRASSAGALEPVDRRPRGLDHTRVAVNTFTPDEANALLEELRPLVERMVEVKRALDEAQERSDEAARRISGNGGGIPPAELGELHEELERRASELAEIVDEIHELG